MAGAKSAPKNAPKVEENAGTRRLLGTFTAPPPLCLGEPYVSSYIRPERHKGKQLTAGPLRHENSKVFPGTISAPVLLWSEQKDKYQESIKYKDIVPGDKKKNGFLSSDYPRRDEFSNTIRTQQLREVLKKENALQKEAKHAKEARDTAINTASAIMDNKARHLPSAPLYDVVFRIPEASLKLARDDRQAGLWYMAERQKYISGTKEEHHFVIPVSGRVKGSCFPL